MHGNSVASRPAGIGVVYRIDVKLLLLPLYIALKSLSRVFKWIEYERDGAECLCAMRWHDRVEVQL